MGKTKGMYFTTFLKYLTDHAGPVTAESVRRELGLPDSFGMLSEYPVRDLVSLQEVIIERLWPGRPLDAGMAELGTVALESFGESMLGRVAMTLVPRDLAKLADRLPGYYAANNKYGSVTSRDVCSSGFRLCFRDYLHYPTYHHGLLQAGWRKKGFGGRVELEVQAFERRGRGEVGAEFDVIFRAA